LCDITGTGKEKDIDLGKPRKHAGHRLTLAVTGVLDPVIQI